VQKQNLELSRQLVVANSKEIMCKLPDFFTVRKARMDLKLITSYGASFIGCAKTQFRFISEKIVGHNNTEKCLDVELVPAVFSFKEACSENIYCDGKFMFSRTATYENTYAQELGGVYSYSFRDSSEECKEKLFKKSLFNMMSPDTVAFENTDDNFLMAVESPLFVTWLKGHNIELSDLSLYEVEQGKCAKFGDSTLSHETVKSVLENNEEGTELHEATVNNLYFDPSYFKDVAIDEVGKPITAEELEARNATHVDKDEEEDALVVEG